MRKLPMCGVALLSAALLISGCGSGGQSASSTGSGDEPVTLTWWHNATDEPLKGYWQSLADSYTAAHPNVTFKIEPVQNEQIARPRSRSALQSNDPPDIFQQWGGGELATQVEAGKVQDITDQRPTAVVQTLGGSAAGWQVDGKQYGLPYSLGIVGLLVQQGPVRAGRHHRAADHDGRANAAVDKLKAAGITPIAVGSKDKWPDAFYWGYFATRASAARTSLQKATKDLTFDDPCFVKAGEDLQTFLATEPFQEGFLGTPAQQGAASSAGLIANGKAAMELQGHWNARRDQRPHPGQGRPGRQARLVPVPGGHRRRGRPGRRLRRRRRLLLLVEAPPACADFLKFMLSAEEQKKFAGPAVGLPVAGRGDRGQRPDPEVPARRSGTHRRSSSCASTRHCRPRSARR